MELEAATFAVSLSAGVGDAVAGVGGGVIVVPALTILFGIDLSLAIGASIVSVFATSSGATDTFVQDRLTNMRTAMFLQLVTTGGAIFGTLMSSSVTQALLYVLFDFVLLLSAGLQVLRLGEELAPDIEPRGLARRAGLLGSCPDSRLNREVPYVAQRVPLGISVMGDAGVISGLLGIGSGALKVCISAMILVVHLLSLLVIR